MPGENLRPAAHLDGRRIVGELCDHDLARVQMFRVMQPRIASTRHADDRDAVFQRPDGDVIAAEYAELPDDTLCTSATAE